MYLCNFTYATQFTMHIEIQAMNKAQPRLTAVDENCQRSQYSKHIRIEEIRRKT